MTLPLLSPVSLTRCRVVNANLCRRSFSASGSPLEFFPLSVPVLWRVVVGERRTWSGRGFKSGSHQEDFAAGENIRYFE